MGANVETVCKPVPRLIRLQQSDVYRVARIQDIFSAFLALKNVRPTNKLPYQNLNVACCQYG